MFFFETSSHVITSATEIGYFHNIYESFSLNPP